jgi:hypothetical protein
MRRSGSIATPCIRPVVIISESAALRTGPCPVAWTATFRSWATAHETAAWTSAAQVAPTAIAGVCWTATLQVATSAAMPSSPAAWTGPCTPPEVVDVGGRDRRGRRVDGRWVENAALDGGHHRPKPPDGRRSRPMRWLRRPRGGSRAARASNEARQRVVAIPPSTASTDPVT